MILRIAEKLFQQEQSNPKERIKTIPITAAPINIISSINSELLQNFFIQCFILTFYLLYLSLSILGAYYRHIYGHSKGNIKREGHGQSHREI